MDAGLDLNKSGNLPDGTAASQAGGFGASAADKRRGYSNPTDNDLRDPSWIADPAAPEVLDGVKTKSPDAVGGFCGRPGGWQR